MGFKVKRQVIVPVFPLLEGAPVYVNFMGPFYLGEKVEKDKEAATLAKVINVVTGELGLIVANEVLKSTLLKEYPNNSYVGKTFEIVKLPKREGKAYNGFRINEGEYSPEEKPASPVASSAGATDSTAKGADSPVPAAVGKTGKK